jgi:DNA modification methylase
MDQGTMFSSAVPSGPVECFGRQFASDEERRAYYLELLRQKLQDPTFRQIDGFPHGTDEDILALSDPPYYTACPNPFLGDFIAHYGRPYDPDEPYIKEPFAADVSEGKNDPIYNAHSYHTKVPHKAIMRYILHYTKPGDIVLDGFCGTGMTGVAAQMCANPEPEFKVKIEQEWAASGQQPPEWGARRAILADLSPAATFIAYNYNTPVDVAEFELEAKRILAKVESEYGWMYQTRHTDGTIGKINFVVWSDVFVCPECASEIVFWDVAVDTEQQSIREYFFCPNCKVQLSKDKLEHIWTHSSDKESIIKQKPVSINYNVSKRRFTKVPDDQDIRLFDKIDNAPAAYYYPQHRMPEGREARRNDISGITHIHQFYKKQNLFPLSAIWELSKSIKHRESSSIKFAHTAINPYTSMMRRFRPDKKGGGPLSGTLYIASLITPPNVMLSFERNYKYIARALELMKLSHSSMIGCQSASSFDMPEDSVDYIFTDPPFGSNFMYSELNFIWEAWLSIITNIQHEAIENKSKYKGINEYQRIMENCFREYFRILKPGRWITIEFSNTKASIWNVLQVSLEQAGFIVANVAALDKKQGSFKAVTTPTAVKQDLVISCYKPLSNLEERINTLHGNVQSAWEFISAHLRYLPVFNSQGNQAQEIVERTPRILYDRLVAYFVRHSYPVPLSSQEFQSGLSERYAQRDGMYFLSEQIVEYDRKRATVREIQQLSIMVQDEVTAIQWLRQQLINKPQTRAELTPNFMQELSGWHRHEVQPELIDLLRQNFLDYDGHGPIPAQIVAWLKKSADMRDLLATDAVEQAQGDMQTTNRELIERAKDRWYVPDPNRAQDLEKVRSRALLKEFESYRAGKGKLRNFRTEAIRAGFVHAYNNKDYRTIVEMANRLPENVLQEDSKLLMYFDNASLYVDGMPSQSQMW